MSLEAMVWAWKRPIDNKLDLLVLLALADYADDKNECWPGIDTLLTKSRIGSKSTLTNCLNRLEETGYISRQKRPSKGGGSKTVLYRLNIGQMYWQEPAEITPSVISRDYSSEGARLHPVYSPSTVNQSERTSQKSIYTESFLFWWSNYPKRQGDQGNKKTAARRYEKLLKSGYTDQQLLNAAYRYRQFCDLTGKTGTEFVKQATTFLNNTDNLDNPWTVNNENNHRADSGRNAKQATINAIWNAPGVGTNSRAGEYSQGGACQRPVQADAASQAAPADFCLSSTGDHRNGES